MKLINNAEKFKQAFGIYATEMWSMSEKEFLEWLNTEIIEPLPNMGLDDKELYQRGFRAGQEEILRLAVNIAR